MPLTSFVGSLKPRMRLKPLANSFNTSVMSEHLKAIDASERITIRSFDTSNSTTVSSTCGPASPTSTEFGPSTSSSAESVMTRETDITTPDDSIPCLHSPTTSDGGEYSWREPLGTQQHLGGYPVVIRRPTMLRTTRLRRGEKNETTMRMKYEEHPATMTVDATTLIEDHEIEPFLKTRDDMDHSTLFDTASCATDIAPSVHTLQDEPTTATMLFDGRLSGDDFAFDRQSSDNGTLFLKMFLKEKWEAQAETCRVNDDVTLDALVDMGRQASHEGIQRCRNLIHCPGLDDEMAISLWSLLSDSVPTPDDLLPRDDDTRSVLSLQFVERFIVPRGDRPSVATPPREPADRPIMSGRRASWVPGDAPQTGTDAPLPRSKSTAHLGGWARRQREKISVAGEAIGRGYGNTHDEATLRIFLLKAMGHLGMSPQDGVFMMRCYHEDKGC